MKFQIMKIAPIYYYYYNSSIVLNLKQYYSKHFTVHKIQYTCIVCLVTLKIGKTIPKKSTGYQIYFLIIFILRTD